jgi:hypothetical protein
MPFAAEPPTEPSSPDQDVMLANKAYKDCSRSCLNAAPSRFAHALLFQEAGIDLRDIILMEEGFLVIEQYDVTSPAKRP